MRRSRDQVFDDGRAAVRTAQRNLLCSNRDDQPKRASVPSVMAVLVADAKAVSRDKRGGWEALRPGLGDAWKPSLTEKSVSTYRSLDNQCCVHHTVVYLIRYAIL